MNYFKNIKFFVLIYYLCIYSTTLYKYDDHKRLLPKTADIVLGEGRVPINRWLTLDLLY